MSTNEQDYSNAIDIIDQLAKRGCAILLNEDGGLIVRGSGAELDEHFKQSIIDNANEIVCVVAMRAALDKAKQAAIGWRG